MAFTSTTSWYEMEDGEVADNCMPFRACTPPLLHAEPQPDPLESFTSSAPRMPTDTHADYRPGAYRDLYATRDDVRHREQYDHSDRRADNRYGGGGGGPPRRQYEAHRGRDSDREPRSVDYFHRRAETGGQPRPPRKPSLRPQDLHAFIFMRQRNHGGRTWFEFLLELRDDQYGFIELPLGRPSMVAAEIAAKRGLLFLPSKSEDLERCFQFLVEPQTAPRAEMPHAVYFLPSEATQRERASRTLPHKAQFIWACESELNSHVQMGQPSCAGVNVSPRAAAAIAAMPLKLRFASMKPPLVLYHGTTIDAGNQIATYGFKAGAKSMLGDGVYFAKFEKALDFAFHDSSNVVREQPGAVVRTYVFIDSCFTMTADKPCTCGCEKPFVDHHGKHGETSDATFVPDNSLPATRRAEWCVRDPRKCFVDCLISAPRPRVTGAHSLPPQFL
jgi:hypothetical protein